MADNPGTRQFTIRLAERLGISVDEADRILEALAALAEEDLEGFQASIGSAEKRRESRRATGFGSDGAFELPARDFDFDKVSLGEN